MLTPVKRDVMRRCARRVRQEQPPESRGLVRRGGATADIPSRASRPTAAIFCLIAERLAQ